MPRPDVIAGLEDAEAEGATKAAIVERSQLAGGLYLFAFLACLVGGWLPTWWRWIEGGLVIFCLTFALRIHALLGSLSRAQQFDGSGGSALNNQRLMNKLGIALLGYAFAAVWAGWPLPTLAVLVASVLNFLHYAGYKDSAAVQRSVAPPGGRRP